MAEHSTAAVGSRSEQSALAFLKGRGLKLIERNFTCRMGEIDLVMEDRECIVFVEVRYRAANQFTAAVESVGPAKQSKLARAAAIFLARNPGQASRTTRFDVVGFDRTTDGTCRLQWVRDAFRPEN